VLNIAQSAMPLQTAPLVATASAQQQQQQQQMQQTPCNPSTTSAAAESTTNVLNPLLMENVRVFQENVEKLRRLRIDTAEYCCLKALVLFTTGETVDFVGVSIFLH